jgi:hypothetical protein
MTYPEPRETTMRTTRDSWHSSLRMPTCPAPIDVHAGFVEPWAVVPHNRRPQGQNLTNPGSKMRVLWSAKQAGPWL